MSGSKSLFQAIRPKMQGEPLFEADALPLSARPYKRDPLDFDPTPHDATAAFLAVEGERLREIGPPAALRADCGEPDTTLHSEPVNAEWVEPASPPVRPLVSKPEPIQPPAPEGALSVAAVIEAAGVVSPPAQPFFWLRAEHGLEPADEMKRRKISTTADLIERIRKARDRGAVVSAGARRMKAVLSILDTSTGRG